MKIHNMPSVTVRFMSASSTNERIWTRIPLVELGILFQSDSEDLLEVPRPTKRRKRTCDVEKETRNVSQRTYANRVEHILFTCGSRRPLSAAFISNAFKKDFQLSNPHRLRRVWAELKRGCKDGRYQRDARKPNSFRLHAKRRRELQKKETRKKEK